MAEGDSFLPRFQSVFYAVFDERQGPKIVYQVPEGLIAVPATPEAASSSAQPHLLRTSDNTSPQKRSVSANKTLFNFDDISKYVIPPSPLCGRLVICPTRNHRVIGFPVELRGRYRRNYFRYNICFVFNRSADLSCYEPVVRKISRVLTSCEEESAFLSNVQTSTMIHSILEQLYEDLNSYSETNIPIDAFNSIQLKIMPFYPNPPPVYDWQVPLALVNLTKRIEPNWDLTMVKVCEHIDGVTHVSKIAYLADCDLELTRQAISHLLHYQVLMMIDIFQYSNMYTLRKSIQWLADETHVIEECGTYVTKPGSLIPDWPKLLHLYSRLKPGKTILEWMQEHKVHTLGIDIRRFTSFGVIKGFLRRVHRWPVLLPSTSPPRSLERPEPDTFPRKRGSSFSGALFPTPVSSDSGRSRPRGRQQDTLTKALEVAVVQPSPVTQTERKTSAAESALELLRTKHQTGRTSSTGSSKTSPANSIIIERHTRTSSEQSQRAQPPNFRSILSKISQGVPTTPVTHSATSSEASYSAVQAKLTSRPRTTRSPSAPAVSHRKTSLGAVGLATNLNPTSPPPPPPPSSLILPPQLAGLLDGEHHTDELATRFEAGWPLLEQWLVSIGGSSGNGDFGRVVMIYR